MKTIQHRRVIEYLEAAKVKLGIRSDYELAKRLQITASAVSRYRKRGTTFDPATAVKVSEILEIPPMRVIADAELERARSPDQREFWRAVLGKVAAIAAGAVGLAIATYPAELVAAVLTAVCVLCKIAVRTFRRLAAASLPSAAALFYPARP